MQISIELPDKIASRLAAGRDLSRTALEALVLEGCRSHRLTEHQAADLLHLDRHELDGFLKQHGIWLDYDAGELERELALGRELRNGTDDRG